MHTRQAIKAPTPPRALPATNEDRAQKRAGATGSSRRMTAAAHPAPVAGAHVSEWAEP